MGSYRKRWEILKNTKKPMNAINVAGKALRFGKADAMIVNDPAVANDIRTTIGQDRGATGEVVVVPTDDTPADPGHISVFRNPGMPYKKYDILGKPIKENEDDP